MSLTEREDKLYAKVPSFMSEISNMNDNSRQIRILQLFGEPLVYGGEEAFVTNVLNSIEEESLIIDCLTPYSCNNDLLESATKKHKGMIYEIGLEFKPGKSRLNTLRPLNIFFGEHHYDVVHIHSGSSTFLAIAAHAAKKGGADKIIVHSHSSSAILTPRKKLIRSVCSIGLAKNADYFFACSKPAAREKFSRLIEHIDIVNNGIDFSKYKFNPSVRQEIRQALEIPPNAILVGHVGRFSKEKNQTFLIDAFKYLQKYEVDSRLLLIGDGELRNLLAKQSETMGLKEKVIFLGNVSNVNEYLNAVDVFVLPSLFEGLGIVGIEAQAANLPVVASDTIPKEVAISSTIKFIPLNAGPRVWAEEIIDAYRHQANRVKPITDFEFDISVIAKKLERLYLSKA